MSTPLTAEELAQRMADEADEIVDRDSVSSEALLPYATVLLQMREALKAIEADHKYQKLHGGMHFTSAPTEMEWKAESAVKAWALLRAALSSANALMAKP